MTESCSRGASLLERVVSWTGSRRVLDQTRPAASDGTEPRMKWLGIDVGTFTDLVKERVSAEDLLNSVNN
jgi:hypothetical protein